MSKTLPPPSPDLGSAIVGLWRLISREDYDRDGRRRIDPIMGPHPLGVLCFAPGYFAAQFMNPDRSDTSGTGPASSGANNSGAVNGYDAYFGTYTLDEVTGTVTVRLERRSLTSQHRTCLDARHPRGARSAYHPARHNRARRDPGDSHLDLRPERLTNYSARRSMNSLTAILPYIKVEPKLV